jgi:hypothetical protein
VSRFGTPEEVPVHVHPELHPHPAEETLEEYAFNRLAEAETAAVEEHILICSTCQEIFQDMDEYILVMKAATAEYDDRPRLAWFGMPAKLAWVAATAVVFLLALPGLTKAVGWWRAEQASITVPVVLAALRGGDGATISQGPAGRPLELSIDSADLPAVSAYRVEVVNATGQPAWSGAATLSNGTLSVQIPHGLKPGTHWVRLFAVQGGLLREFGLRLR